MPQDPIWIPAKAHISASRLTQFIRFIENETGEQIRNYDTLYQWSINNISQFWSFIWDFFAIKGNKGGRLLIDEERMPGAKFFPDAKLNFAENLLTKNDDSDAIVFWGEDRVKSRLSWRELNEKVSQFAQELTEAGVSKGDRIVAYMPNLPETIIAMLSATSLGAIWSSCSPDYGENGVIDRFSQIDPKLMIACDGYFYNGKAIDILPKLKRISDKIPSIKKIIVVPYLQTTLGGSIDLSEFDNAELIDDIFSRNRPALNVFKQLPFNHPLYILFSSGTTGVPKCIVHSAGGTLLQHVKEHQLHVNIKQGDRFFYFTTCAWMMWNWLVSGLASKATLLLYDGSPFYRDGNILWDLAETERMTQFGTSAKYLESLRKFEIRPKESHELRHLRLIVSTGSPLAPESYDYARDHIKKSAYVGSIAGGTDIVSCFVLTNPIKPVHRGDIPCRGLGMAVEIWNEDKQSVTQIKGELVCTKPFPSMPLSFWGDTNNEKYRATYFEHFPGVWVQGDYAEITATGGIIIYGRSDTTLNPGGVRIGTAEIYRQVEKIDGVIKSVVVGQKWGNDIRIVLFVVLEENVILGDTLVTKIKKQIKFGASPRHTPSLVIQVDDIPITKSGKIAELVVKNVIEGVEINNITSLSNPEALDNFKNLNVLDN